MSKIVHSSWFMVHGRKKTTINYELPTINQLAFTLIELMIAISIIAVIASIGYVSLNQSQAIGRDSRRKSDLRNLQTALELYKNDPTNSTKTYPFPVCATGTGCVSTSGGDWIPTTPTFSPTYISRTPLDPINTTSPARRYIYTSADGLTYSLCTNLEITTDPDPNNSAGTFCLTPP